MKAELVREMMLAGQRAAQELEAKKSPPICTGKHGYLLTDDVPEVLSCKVGHP